jgi:membrane protease YdiL (CAAX protease family)
MAMKFIQNIQKNIKSNNSGSIFMLAYFIYLIAVQYIYGILHYIFPDSSFLASQWANVSFQIVCFLIPLAAIYMFKRPPSFLHLFRFRKIGIGNIIFIAAICICIRPMMTLLSFISSLVFPNTIAEAMMEMQSGSLMEALIIIAAVPSICEELMFRGYLFDKYRDYPIKQTALVNGIFFAVMHMNPQQLLYTFVMGVIFTFLAYHTRSLFAPITAHFFMNGSQVLLSWGSGSEAFLEEETAGSAISMTSGELLQTFLVLLVSAGIFWAIFTVLFDKFIAHNKKRNTIADAKNSEDSEDKENNIIPQEYTQNIKSPFDLFFWLVIIIYILLMIWWYLPYYIR